MIQYNDNIKIEQLKQKNNTLVETYNNVNIYSIVKNTKTFYYFIIDKPYNLKYIPTMFEDKIFVLSTTIHKAHKKIRKIFDNIRTNRILTFKPYFSCFYQKEKLNYLSRLKYIANKDI